MGSGGGKLGLEVGLPLGLIALGLATGGAGDIAAIPALAGAADAAGTAGAAALPTAAATGLGLQTLAAPAEAAALGSGAGTGASSLLPWLNTAVAAGGLGTGVANSLKAQPGGQRQPVQPAPNLQSLMQQSQALGGTQTVQAPSFSPGGQNPQLAMLLKILGGG